MTQEYPSEPGPARPDDDVGPPAGSGPVYGPPTTVAARRRTSRAGRPARPPRAPGEPPVALEKRPRRRFGAFFGDRRGLTFLGAVLVAAVIGTIGGLISAGTRGWVGTVFTVCFVAGCVLAALLVHREDLLTVAFMPPLLFVAIGTAVGVAQALLSSAAVKKKVIFQVGYAMSFGAKTMWIATATTAAVAIVMLIVRKRPNRAPRTPAPARAQVDPLMPSDAPAPYNPSY